MKKSTSRILRRSELESRIESAMEASTRRLEKTTLSKRESEWIELVRGRRPDVPPEQFISHPKKRRDFRAHKSQVRRKVARSFATVMRTLAVADHFKDWDEMVPPGEIGFLVAVAVSRGGFGTAAGLAGYIEMGLRASVPREMGPFAAMTQVHVPIQLEVNVQKSIRAVQEYAERARRAP